MLLGLAVGLLIIPLGLMFVFVAIGLELLAKDYFRRRRGRRQFKPGWEDR